MISAWQSATIGAQLVVLQLVAAAVLDVDADVVAMLLLLLMLMAT